MTNIIALISTYKETDLLASCLESAKDCDAIIVFDGPTNAPTEIRKDYMPNQAVGNQMRAALSLRRTNKHYTQPVSFYSGRWNSDAHKRTEMLEMAKTHQRKDSWGLWLDGDEILLWGEYLHDHCNRAEMETATGGTTLRIVEYDGSVALCYGKLIKLSAVARYVMSSYEIELTNGMTVALPNVKICSQGGIPYVTDEFGITRADDERLATHRPPLQGEPHLLHRHGLRSPTREVERLHETEADSFSVLVKDAGLEGVDKQTAKGEVT
jgi:hypothetical protein